MYNFIPQIIVPLSYQASLLTAQAVLNRIASVATITPLGQTLWSHSIANCNVVMPFILAQPNRMSFTRMESAAAFADAKNAKYDRFKVTYVKADLPMTKTCSRAAANGIA